MTGHGTFAWTAAKGSTGATALPAQPEPAPARKRRRGRACVPDMGLAASLLILAVTPAPNVTPVGSATGDIVSYILGYGVVGVVALAFAFRFIVPASVVREAREQARTDIRAELDRCIAEKETSETRLIAERHAVEEQRDEALKLAQRELVPLLVSFTATAGSLVPLLQELVRTREARRDRGPGR